MGFLDIFKGNHGLLQDPGDEFNARITNSGRKVAKLKNKHGKFSSTIYEGDDYITRVDTKTTKFKKNNYFTFIVQERVRSTLFIICIQPLKSLSIYLPTIS